MLEYSTSTSTPPSPRSASVTESSRAASAPSSFFVTIHARMGPAYAAARGGSAEQDRRFVVALLRHGLELAEGGLERHRHHLGALQRHHLAPAPAPGQVEHRHPQAGGEHAVIRGRCAAALDVT